MSAGNALIPKSFYWIAGVALIWNLIGVGAYVSQVAMTPEMLGALSEAERVFYEDVPAWATAAFGTAVTGGVLGCLLLLLRKSLAVPVLIVSLVAVLIQNFDGFFLRNAMSVVGAGGAAVSGAVIIIGVYLVWFANDAKSKGWLT